jgi:lysophospholipase L1-like esterase
LNHASAPQTIACLGSSSTAGKGQAFDWITELRDRPENALIQFRNFGAGGDLAYNALQRLPEVIACSPDKVIVWLGANDVLARVSPKVRRVFSVTKHLPGAPTPQLFGESLTEIAHRLRSTTRAVVGLCSLVPIGENLESTNPFQGALNRCIEEYSTVIAAVANETRCSYVPLYEAIAAQIRLEPGKPFAAFRFLDFYRDAFRVFALRQNPDDIGERNGWRFHTDGVHLNSRSGRIVADLVQSFIDS